MEWGKVSVIWKIIYLTEEDDIASGYYGHEDKITPRYVFYKIDNDAMAADVVKQRQ